MQPISRHGVRAGRELAQFIIGTADPLEVAEAGKMRLAGDARRLLPVLFPDQHPMLQVADRY